MWNVAYWWLGLLLYKILNYNSANSTEKVCYMIYSCIYSIYSCTCLMFTCRKTLWQLNESLRQPRQEVYHQALVYEIIGYVTGIEIAVYVLMIWSQWGKRYTTMKWSLTFKSMSYQLHHRDLNYFSGLFFAEISGDFKRLLCCACATKASQIQQFSCNIQVRVKWCDCFANWEQVTYVCNLRLRCMWRNLAHHSG